MPDRLDPDRLRAALLAQLQAAAGDAMPEVALDYRLGSSGVTVDLAVAAEEFIGFVVGTSPAETAERLAVGARYLDRVVLVVDAADAARWANVPRAGAALWTVDEAGEVHECQPSRANIVGPSALLDLMSPDQRDAMLRQAMPVGAPHDRTRTTVDPTTLRAEAARSFTPAPCYWRASDLV